MYKNKILYSYDDLFNKKWWIFGTFKIWNVFSMGYKCMDSGIGGVSLKQWVG